MRKRSNNKPTSFISTLLIVIMAFGTPIGVAQDAKGQKRKETSVAAKKLTEEQRVVHLLDRVTFGGRPGDVERVMKLGWEKYLDEQLHPDRLSDQVVEQKLKNIESIHQSNTELAKNYPPPQVLQQVLKERGVELPGFNQNQNAGQSQNAGQNQNAGQSQNAGQTDLTKKDAKKGFKQLEQNPKKADMPDEQEMANPQAGSLQQAGSPRSGANDQAKRREAYLALREMGYRPQQEIVQEAQQAKILRAVYSERQLQEVMTDFWFNHFNVYIQKGPDRILTASYERDAIRPNVFGKFEDLLKATAEHPAMLFYLDNWMSASPNAKMPEIGRAHV